ncbi:lytic polysaccharide monooxygenase [Pleomassaria siparia CBS 279.74]|uniref:Lytic polysaccharide monooxygenase n=1 Tax=Pleomassaria siparia CBS 279.74 TaxID=1314801 RepID=A0A6G1KAX9_9PLEO|nr:lytic polysaccharide monooxygenase [Pleomassaria siparia CBS 279.74]
MSSFRSTVLAAALLATAANAHMMMEYPVPYSLEKLGTDNGPVSASTFPCHSQYGYDVTTMNPMKVGNASEVKLKGSAVHGGGSCQLVVTTDMAPTKDSKFKVIKSFEGNCPVADTPLPFTLPDSIPNGKATFAYTWFAKSSGAPEMYMNCAPIEVSGGASDTTAFDALPDWFVANIGGSCISPQNFDTKFPNPGAEVATGQGVLKDPTGDCGATGSTPTTPTNPSAAPSAAPSAPVASAPVASAAPSAPVASAPAAPVASAPVPSVVAPAPSSTSPPPASESDLTCDEDEPVATAAPSAAPPSASTAPVPAPGNSGSACTTNGAIMCNGTTQFGLCNNGNVVWQPVAAGTTCVGGAIQKRSTAFHKTYNGRIVRPKASASYRI